MVFPKAPRRFRSPRFGSLPRPAPVWGTDSNKLYGLLLMLVLMLFFMFTFSGQAPHAVEKVFDAQQQQQPVEQPQLSEAGRAARHFMIQQRYGGALYDPKDGTGFAETPGYRLLIQELLTEQVRSSEVGVVPKVFDYALATKDPDALRGQRVRMTGAFAGLYQDKYAVALDTPVFKVSDVWRGVITDFDGNGGVIFDVLDRPDGIEPRDEVELEGIFYRIVS